MAAATKEWSPNHESALTGLVGLGIPKKEAQSHLKGLPSAEVGDLMRQALASRTRSQAPPGAIAGGPSGAVPLHPPTASAQPATATSTPAPPEPAAAKGPSMRDILLAKAATAQQPQGPTQGGPRRDLFNRIADTVFGAPKQRAPVWPVLPPMRGQAGSAQTQPTGPAAAQIQPGPAPTPPPVKPRIRMRAAGQRIPPAPIGKGAPTEEPEAPAEAKEKATPLPLIRSAEEYEQLAPGTEFIWRSDGHVYEKPAPKTAEA